MADVEAMEHCGMTVPDVRAAEEFYERILDARIDHRSSLRVDDLGSSPHSNVVLGDFFFVLFPHMKEPPAAPRPRGMDGSRKAYAVPRARFEEVVERLRENGVPFEGPVEHPAKSPVAESVYFTDPGGNYLEVCWRRDPRPQGLPVHHPR
jgi:catechol 2,3-dioxygenase-like lactoylglutathione lyase family enzyme